MDDRGLFSCGLFVVSSLFVSIPLGDVWMADFRISAEDAALASRVCTFCYALGTLVYAPLSDR